MKVRLNPPEGVLSRSGHAGGHTELLLRREIVAYTKTRYIAGDGTRFHRTPGRPRHGQKIGDEHVRLTESGLVRLEKRAANGA